MSGDYCEFEGDDCFGGYPNPGPEPNGPAYGTKGGFPDETWDGEWEPDQGDDDGAYFYRPDEPCDGSCVACGGPIEREYCVTATLQVCVKASNGAEAALVAKDMINDLITGSDFPQDLLNGAIIDSVDDITVEL